MNTPSIDPGRFRHRLDLESQNEVPDGCGGFSSDWQLLGQVWAAIDNRSSIQDTQIDRLNTRTLFDITIRWRADCLPRMRFQKSGREFLIQTIRDRDETKRYLICTCEEIK